MIRLYQTFVLEERDGKILNRLARRAKKGPDRSGSGPADNRDDLPFRFRFRDRFVGGLFSLPKRGIDILLSGYSGHDRILQGVYRNRVVAAACKWMAMLQRWQRDHIFPFQHLRFRSISAPDFCLQSSDQLDNRSLFILKAHKYRNQNDQ